jgi:uncharacterized protein
MNLKQLGNMLEDTTFWKEGFVVGFFDLLPVFLIVFLALIIWIFRKQAKAFNKKFVIIVGVLVTLPLLLGIWGYNFERNWLQVNEQKVQVGFKAKIALFSDIHIGRFKDKNWVDKVIAETNKIENLDAVLVAGDWTYWPKDISKAGFMYDFASFKNSRYPTYAVLGNHDVEKPGPRVRAELESALNELGVKIIDDKSVEFVSWNLVGLEDIWSEKYNGIQSNLLSSTKPNLALTHQPDIVRDYDKLSTKPVLTLTGHTHCGQVRIPFLYKLALPTIDAFYDKGWYEMGWGEKPIMTSKLFISCGVGEVGLPIRLLNSPTIDVLTLY